MIQNDNISAVDISGKCILFGSSVKRKRKRWQYSWIETEKRLLDKIYEDSEHVLKSTGGEVRVEWVSGKWNLADGVSRGKPEFGMKKVEMHSLPEWLKNIL